MIDFGEKLKELRITKRLTQEQLATQLGLTKFVVSAYETGIRMPSYDVLLGIASVFNVTTDFLLGVEKTSDNTIDVSGLTEHQRELTRRLIREFHEINRM